MSVSVPLTAADHRRWMAVMPGFNITAPGWQNEGQRGQRDNAEQMLDIHL